MTRLSERCCMPRYTLCSMHAAGNGTVRTARLYITQPRWRVCTVLQADFARLISSKARQLLPSLMSDKC